MRTLIGTVGYRNLRDHSAGFAVLERLTEYDLGPDVVLEDVSYNPIALVQWFEDQAGGATFDRIILVSAVTRPGRVPGTVVSYPWDRKLPADALIQQAVVEAVTGIIALDNTLVIAGYFGALPSSVTIIEIEPEQHEFGPELSPPVERAVESAVAVIRNLTQPRQTLS